MSELAPLISDLALILICAGVMTLVFKRLKQPLVLGYIVAGFLASPHVPLTPSVIDVANIHTWSEIGVIFLLFALGLEFSFKKLVKVGGTAVIAACTIIFCMILVGIFKWGESALINVTGALLAFLYYIMIRNRILFKSLIEQSLQLEKVKVDQLETELKFLKSQYHPHFLFNALNTIYFQVDENNKVAKQSIEQLSDLLRYQLYDIEKEVTMEQEINYLRSYIAFQQLRMSERLMLDLYFDPQLKEQKIHPLLLQPLIENAFKYVRGDYKIKLEIKVDGNQIQSEIKNSISSSPSTANKKEKGIGIENLKRRLDLLYPEKYSLDFKQTDHMFIDKLTINTD